MPNIEIITIGDEILIGQIVDTNSAWMATELNKSGFDVVQITSVHDNENHITSSLNNAMQRADVVLLTGGIGPTRDDITKHTLCKFFDCKLVYNADVYHDIENLLKYRSRAMNELTASQAMVPEKCTVIRNPVGTAPVTWFEKDGKVVVSMPGVPYEMKNAMSTEIIPRLKSKFRTPVIIHKTVQVYGYPESALALKIENWENALPDNIHLAYLPNYGIVRLRLSGSSENSLALEFSINQQIDLLKQILGEAVVATSDDPLEVITGKLLAENNMKLATAESCTGGNIAHILTTVPGSSAYFSGGVVAYSNEIKVNLLGVSASDLSAYGAVSKQVAEQMAEGIKKITGADIAVATTGIAGPSGGTVEKPVGTVWIAVNCKNQTSSREFKFNGTRQIIIERTTQAALLMVGEMLTA